jgi:hypothetical protein
MLVEATGLVEATTLVEAAGLIEAAMLVEAAGALIETARIETQRVRAPVESLAWPAGRLPRVRGGGRAGVCYREVSRVGGRDGVA